MRQLSGLPGPGQPKRHDGLYGAAERSDFRVDVTEDYSFGSLVELHRRVRKLSRTQDDLFVFRTLQVGTGKTITVLDQEQATGSGVNRPRHAPDAYDTSRQQLR